MLTAFRGSRKLPARHGPRVHGQRPMANGIEKKSHRPPPQRPTCFPAPFSALPVQAPASRVSIGQTLWSREANADARFQTEITGWRVETGDKRKMSLAELWNTPLVGKRCGRCGRCPNALATLSSWTTRSPEPEPSTRGLTPVA